MTVLHSPACEALLHRWDRYPRESMPHRLADFAHSHTDPEVMALLVTFFDEDPPGSLPWELAVELWPTLAIGGAR
ncbi:hypothetical protein [Nocardia sp. NPDC057227]|uniref:hypothetical protein n=1 Tax=Nocardia sp. NPDC057227 TaxID=3346056 RepID=UPI003626C1AD